MRERKKIGIDIDDVVVKFMESYLDFHNLRLRTSFSTEDVANYHLWECGIHSSKEESMRMVSAFGSTSAFWDLPLVEGAKNGVERLSQTYDPVFVTARPKFQREITKNYFARNFPRNGYHLLFSGGVYEGRTKAEICLDEGIPLIIEDNPLYAFDCAREGIKAILLAKPWNREYNKHRNLVRVLNWEGVLDEALKE